MKTKTSVRSKLARCGGRILLGSSLMAAALLRANAADADTNVVTITTGTVQPRAMVGPLLYSVSFPGGSVKRFAEFWRENVSTNDSFVIIPEVQQVQIPEFKVRNVRLAELGRSIEFLCHGKLEVQVVEKENSNGANLWRMGNTSPESVHLVMRAVAAPKLFRLNRSDAVVRQAQELSDERRRRSLDLGSTDSGCSVVALKEQSVFVVIGSGEAVAGIESFIKAAEEAAQPRF